MKKDRQVVIDYQVEDRERLNSIGAELNYLKSHSKMFNELKRALKASGESVEHLPYVKMNVTPYKKDAPLSDVRAYIYESKKCHSEDMKVEGNSHIVQVSIRDSNSVTGWHNGETDFPAKVYVDLDGNKNKVKWLIEDIRLDIIMFYYHSLDEIFVSADERRAFSRKKVQYVKTIKQSSYLGNIDCTDNPEYISVAAFFRTGEDIDWDGYFKCWKEMIKAIKRDIRKRTKLLKGLDIFKTHPKYGQISLRRLSILLEAVDAGEYYLIRTEKKPREEIKQKEIMSRFGLVDWKTGKIKIIPARSRFTWERLKPYISMFSFAWGEYEE